MNERIKTLAKVAGYDEINKAAMKLIGFDPEKFALLIVQECVEQLRYTVLNTQELRRDKSTDYQVGWEDGMFDAGEMIKEHFRS
jgi:hypothetical protein